MNGKCKTDYELRDYGNTPFVVNIDRLTKTNQNFRTALWTGNHLQVTLMCIKSCGDIGVEMHPDVDQFIRIESGCGIVKMGCCKEDLCFMRSIDSNYAVVIPAGTWHNIINTGNTPLKLYSVYAPPQHPYGTVHRTKESSQRHM